MNNSRDYTLDRLKGIAIILVLVGHVIQAIDADFKENHIFLFIYSFHMPLFFFCSGAVNKGTIDILYIVKLMRSLIYPMLSMLLLLCLFRFRYVDSSILNPFAWPLWFLRELFIMKVCSAFLERYVKEYRFLAALLLWIIFVFCNSEILKNIVFYFPFFILGGLRLHVSKSYPLLFYVGLLLICICIYCNRFDFDNLSYAKSSIDLYSLPSILSYHVLACFIIIGLYSSLNGTDLGGQVLVNIGSATLFIYFVQTILIENVLPLIQVQCNSLMLSLFWSIFLTFLILQSVVILKRRARLRFMTYI